MPADRPFSPGAVFGRVIEILETNVIKSNPKIDLTCMKREAANTGLTQLLEKALRESGR